MKYLFWAGIISCFIGEAFKIRVFDLFVLFPLRVIVVLALPIILLNPTKRKKGIWCFALRLQILMIIYGIVSISWSPDPRLGLRMVGMLFFGLMIFLLVSRYAIDLSVLKKIMIVWSIMVIVTSLLGVYEMMRGEYLFSHVTDGGATTDIALMRIAQVGWLAPRVFLPGSNEFAFFNVVSSLILMGWAFESRGGYRMLALIATLLVIIMLMYSYSRAAIFGFLIGLMCFVFIFTIKKNVFYRIVTILLMISLSVLLLYKGEELLNSSSMVVSALVTKINTDDNLIRKFYYTTAVFEGTIGSYGFGRGLGASTEIISGGSYHQYLLEILAELGLWLFLGYLILIAKVCIQLWRAIRQRRNIFWSCGLLASCIAFTISCAGPASIVITYPYWLWLTFVVAFTEYDSIVMRLNQTAGHNLKFNRMIIKYPVKQRLRS